MLAGVWAETAAEVDRSVGVWVNVLDGALAGVVIAVVSGTIVLEMLADVGVNVLVAAMTDSELTMSGSLLPEPVLFCPAATSCWPMAVLDCAHALHAWMPPYHVCFDLPAPPHLLNQEPP